MAKSNRNYQLGSLRMQILFNLEGRNRTLELRENPLQNLILLVVFEIKLNQIKCRNISGHTYPSLGEDGGNRSKSQGGGDPANQICFHFNRIVISACELPNNLCRNRRQHKCLTCQQWGCKQLNHFPQPVPAAQNFNQAGRSQAHVIIPPAQCGW